MITNTLLICSSRSSSCTETSKICSIEGSTFYDSIRQNNCIPRWTAEPEIQCYHIERSLFANFQIYCMDQSCFVPTVPERKARSKALSTAYNTHHGDAYSYLVPLVQPYQEATRCWTFQSKSLRSSCCKLINDSDKPTTRVIIFRINQIDYRNITWPLRRFLTPATRNSAENQKSVYYCTLRNFATSDECSEESCNQRSFN